MKKILSVMLLLAICAVTLCGCGLNDKPLTLGSSMEIPEDGIVEASVFKLLRDENKVMTFYGQSENTYYEWTVFGNDVISPQDTNMKLEVTKDEDGRLDFSLCTGSGFGFSAVLSIHSTHIWTSDGALVYCIENGSAEPFSSASVIGARSSVLNFSLTQPGAYFIAAESSADSNEQAFVLTEKNEETAAPSKAPRPEDSYLTASSSAKGVVVSGESQSEHEAEAGGIVPSQAPVPADSYLTASNSAGLVISDGKYDRNYADAASGQGPVSADPYLSASESSGGRVISDGKQSGKDMYLTDPVPKGKPMPSEPEDRNIDENNAHTCTFSIECTAALNNLDDLNPDKLDAVPSSGVILSKRKVTFYEGESVYDVLQRVCKENGIHMEASWTPIYNSAYIEGIHNLYEFDCGTNSGWMYRVNGWYPNYGCSRYQLAQGDNVEWRYTCDLGADVGGGYATGN